MPTHTIRHNGIRDRYNGLALYYTIVRASSRLAYGLAHDLYRLGVYTFMVAGSVDQ